MIAFGLLAGLAVGLFAVLVEIESAASPKTATPFVLASTWTPTREAPAPSPRVPATASSTAALPSPTQRPTATSTHKPATQRPSTASPRAATSTPARSPTRTAIPSSGKLAPVISRGTAPGVVALTFDLGGTEAGATAHVLDTLKASRYTATFFLTGQWAAANPALAKRMAAEGHELANHTYSHPRLTEIPPDRIRSEIWTTETAILQASGTLPKWMLRPPFGSYDSTVRIVLADLGYELITWTVDSGDWQGLTSQQIVARVAQRVKAGDVVVFHAYAQNTGQAIGGVCETLKAKGLTGRTLSRALGR